MVDSAYVAGALVAGALAVTISSVPFLLTGLDYRQRDNGLAYILLVTGVGTWNGLFVAQLLTDDPTVKTYFFSLSIVGTVLAGLGWLLFAATASSTPYVLDRRGVYGLAAVLAGLDVALAVTAPVHSFYWDPESVGADALGFALIDPAPGYWLHMFLLILLFGAGAALFAITWSRGAPSPYPMAYTLAGTATFVLFAAGTVLAPGGFGVAPIVAGSLTTIGWIQATRGDPLGWLRRLT